LKAVSGKALARALERKGWRLQRVTGSHHIYSKEGHVARISVPIHGNQPLKVGLVRHLMKIAEITGDDL
jgi:predicted RNA binding protein YcfA (HicA-like mRNA interferase family)